MAEINVERKKNVWPWVVGLIVLLLAIWAVMALMNTDERRTYDPALGTTTTEPMSPAAQQPATQQPMQTTAPADTAITGDAATTGDAGEPVDRTTPPPPPQQ